MAGGTSLFDDKFDRVLIAVGADFDDLLNVAGGLALAPERAARTRPVPRLACVYGLRERVLVHIGEHQEPPVCSVRCGSGDQPVSGEFRREAAGFLDGIVDVVPASKRRFRHKRDHISAAPCGPARKRLMLRCRRGAAS